MRPLGELAQALIQGDRRRVEELTAEALAASIHPGVILDDGLLAGMKVVGERFRVREIFLPEVLMAARAMHAGMALLEPLLAAEGVPTAGRVVLGTVRGDLHDIGKNLVGIMLRGAGFEVVDLGFNVEPQALVRAAVERGAPVIGMSALRTTTMPVMREVVDRLRAEGLEGRIRTLVGGAPLTAEYARSIGADAYARDAYTAVEVVKRLVGAA
ncbi:MAG: cobalamin-binding protein [Gemmatimonadetes bacterium]|nr:cobalamin-binding protein [Gemmatimonadota bacterium]